jgi:hypothetical protein
MSYYALPGLHFPPLETGKAVEGSHISSDYKEEKTEFDFDVDVSAAKIDTAKLVQSLMAGPSSRRRPRSKTCECTPQEEAMQFELYVCFNGRSYSVIRNLPNILQLRQELARENLIPEVPRVEEEARCRGFTLLDALLRSYVPLLRDWLRQVIRLVPHDNPSLVHFFWEPLYESDKWNSSFSSLPSFSERLGSIEESEHDCEE